MKHEKFKILGDKTVGGFLQSKNIVPRSISVTNLSDISNIYCIGYVEETTEDVYFLHAVEIEAKSDPTETEKLIEAEAEKLGGVICQDVHFGPNRTIYITFLTHK